MSDNAIRLPSERRFGALFVGVFAVLAGYSAFKGWAGWLTAALTVCSATMLAATVWFAQRLRPLNAAWARLGRLLGRIVNPIVLGILYFLLITPVAVIGRAVGRDPLRLRLRDVPSYWIERSPIGPEPDSFENQY